jgi:hypothetical protein
MISSVRNRSVEKPASTRQFIRRIFAAGRFFIAFGGAPRHEHSFIVAALKGASA